MNFHFPWTNPNTTELAALRDRLERLERLVEHPRKGREPRKDKASIIAAKQAKTEQLLAELGRVRKVA